MSRKRVVIKPRGGGEASVSLFPFLAVLLCTMGALIMLLVVIARNIREQNDVPVDLVVGGPVQTEGLSEEEAERILEQIQLDTEEAEWFGDLFTKSKTQAENDLAEVRAVLASSELQTQKIKDELKRLENLADQLNKPTPAISSGIEELDNALRQRQRQKQDLESVLGRLRQEAERDAKSYAIVPYRGTGGTFRRPIYVECRDGKVIIQPEGVVLSPEDFELADRPDNPMDAALRVVRQYYTETNQIQRGTEPYPLMIVRPSGVDAYLKVRRAMGSWINEFGYELIDEDWKLEYPASSEELRQRLEKQLDASRTRMFAYKTAMRAERIGAAMSRQYRVDSQGVVQPIDRPFGREYLRGMSGPEENVAKPSGQPSNHRGQSSVAGNQSGTPGSAGGAPPTPSASQFANQSARSGSVSGMPGSTSAVSPTPNPGSDPARSNGLDESMPESLKRERLASQVAPTRVSPQRTQTSAQTPALSPTLGTAIPGTTYSQQFAPSDSSAFDGGEMSLIVQNGSLNGGWQTGQRQDQQQSQQQDRQQLAAGNRAIGSDLLSTEKTGQETSTDSRERQNVSNPDASGREMAGQDQGQGQEQSQGSHFMVRPESAGGMPAVALSATTTPEMHQHDDPQHNPQRSAMKARASKAPPDQQRADNWALRNMKPFSAAIKRNVKIRCETDKIVLVEQAGLMGIRVVPITDSMFAATDHLVMRLWEFMESWETAGEKYYWQPVLQIEIAPGAEQRFEELNWLLRNSGLVIEKAEPGRRRR